jgi:hypothetical protein
MRCHNCGNELPLDDAVVCPVCGKALPQQGAGASELAPGPARVNWLLFFAVLLTPPLLTALIVQGGRQTEGLAVCSALLGGTLGGVAGGIMLGRRFGSTSQTRIGLGIVLAGVLSVVCIGLSCFGCLAGGFHLDFR